jgi:hypothetical protein
VQIPYGLLPPFSEAQAPQPRPKPSHRPSSTAQLPRLIRGNLLVLDWTNRLRVFSPKGKRLSTRNDFGLCGTGFVASPGVALAIWW